ncbi:HlyD family secretion protein [Terasakiella pusilla]|uniref:HlyD family secretion protein n=1 Tax=Terasakiella pusilla TaxID=64973 RepID=UPI003AA7C3B6
MKKSLLVFLCGLTLASCTPEKATIPGYVDGDTLSLAPTSSGVLASLTVREGQIVSAGTPLFSLDLADLQAKADSAAAATRRAEAELKDLLKGERPEELEVLFKQAAQAKANLENAQKEYDRIMPLSKTGAVSLSRRDEVITNLDSAKARAEEVNAQIVAANLGARSDKVEAARANIEIEKAQHKQIVQKLKEATPTSPKESLVLDTFFQPGEYVGAGQTVVKLLPPENIKIKFFIPVDQVTTVKMGQTVLVSCDGCPTSYPARITHIASESEYTPPVIFSVESRDKLVFMIEAQPTAYHEALRLGLPISVSLEAGS